MVASKKIYTEGTQSICDKHLSTNTCYDCMYIEGGSISYPVDGVYIRADTSDWPVENLLFYDGDGNSHVVGSGGGGGATSVCCGYTEDNNVVNLTASTWTYLPSSITVNSLTGGPNHINGGVNARFVQTWNSGRRHFSVKLCNTTTNSAQDMTLFAIDDFSDADQTCWYSVGFDFIDLTPATGSNQYKLYACFYGYAGETGGKTFRGYNMEL